MNIRQLQSWKLRRIVKSLPAVAMTLSFSAVGLLLSMNTSAATYQSAIEAEDGVVSGNAAVVDDTSASNGKQISFQAAAKKTSAKPVFAWYHTPFYTYSSPNASDADAIAGHKREIKEAQAAGLDGFVLYIGNQQYLFDNTRKIFEAAKQVHNEDPTKPPFLLYLGPEAAPNDAIRWVFPGTNTNWLVHYMTAFASHPNYYKYQRQPVLSSFLGLKVDPAAGVDQQSDWVSYVFTPLKNQGIDAYFVPTLFNTRDVTTKDAAGNHTTSLTAWGQQHLDGLSYWPGNSPTNDINGTNYMANVTQLNSKSYAGSVAVAHYWAKHAASPHVYFEHYGGEGPGQTWKNTILNHNASWIVEATWNDYAEAYASPVDPSTPTILTGYGVEPLLKPHAGYNELSKYYRQWYKTGQAPAITKDGLIYFYRTHAKDLVASNDSSAQNFNPGTSNETVPDDLFITTMLKTPATLKVTSGGVVTNKAVAAGLQFTRVPFQAGQQEFQIVRDNTTVISASGEPILSSIEKYNFIPTSGFVYSAN